MKRKLCMLIVLLTIAGCKNSDKGFQKIITTEDGRETTQAISDNERFVNSGVFAYNVQYAHFSTNQIESKGVCDLEKFQAEFNNFKWKEQLTEANIRGTVSPTISVRHNPSKYEMGISVVGNDSTDYGFWIFFGKSGKMGLVEVLDEASVRPYIAKFFDKEFENLQAEF
ncbi:hypothetical protein WIW50_04970 [Flavobacteriaceae bacterium 3-367]|uniref:hypothetical protein n=1 Tax=Eudoraea algarum TaxID=3417568 RepID=UPI00328DC409